MKQREHVLRRARAGYTLIELLVALTIVGMIAGLVTLTFAHGEPGNRDDRRATVARQLAAARSSALRTGQVVVIRIEDSLQTRFATAMPDGSVLVDSEVSMKMHWNRLIGSPIAATVRSARR